MSIGYFLMVFSAVFINTPIIAFVVIPLFITGAIFVMIFYTSLIDRKRSYARVKSGFIIFGCTVLSFILGYTAVAFDQFKLNREGALTSDSSVFTIMKVITIIGIYLIAILFIYLGIRKSEKLKNRKLFNILLPAFYVLPVTILLMQLAIAIDII